MDSLHCTSPGRRRAAPLALALAGGLAVRLVYIALTRPSGTMIEMERAAASIARSGTMADILADRTGPSAHVAPL
ncbi:MAG TPA: hypothetical protein VHF22_04195, partial [Planctomycetota bacterium]|nr:hypothetical protein [Planctomycetota bacterium]